jgi:hypothetical protein
MPLTNKKLFLFLLVPLKSVKTLFGLENRNIAAKHVTATQAAGAEFFITFLS